MKRNIFIFIFIISISSITAQISSQAESARIAAAIREALQDIARNNYEVQYAVYDGMTYKQVCNILGTTFSIQPVPLKNYGRNGIQVMSYNGNYIIFWSSSFQSSNPVVLGISPVDSDQIFHNKLK